MHLSLHRAIRVIERSRIERELCRKTKQVEVAIVQRDVQRNHRIKKFRREKCIGAEVGRIARSTGLPHAKSRSKLKRRPAPPLVRCTRKFSSYTRNDSPQPHSSFTFGLLNLKPSF